MSESNVYVVEPKPLAGDTQIDPAPADRYRAGRRATFLRVALAEHNNIVMAGGTRAGKTTARSDLMEEGAGEQRIVSIENGGEVFLRKRRSDV